MWGLVWALAVGEEAVLAGGCFWCLEAVLEQVPGVTEVTSGYTGDSVTPSYGLVTEGDTDHAEAVRVRFDAGRVSYRQLLDVFFDAHDPTQKDGQGSDLGRQCALTRGRVRRPRRRSRSESCR